MTPSVARSHGLPCVAILVALAVGSSTSGLSQPAEGRSQRRASAATAPVGRTDFNGDGFADLAVSAPKENVSGRSAAGAVNVIYGSSDGLTAAGNQFWHQDKPGMLGSADQGDHLGAALVAGDFDGDGFSDLAIGVRGEKVGPVLAAGAVAVIHGSADGLTAAGNQLWHQDSPGILDVAEPGDRFGQTLAAGDFDGDGFADLAVGMRFEDVGAIPDAGAVQVLYGSAKGLAARGNQLWHQDSPGIESQARPGEQIGWALASGDLNGDGFDDLAIGAAYNDHHATRSGAVHVILGSSRGLTAKGSQLWHQDSPGIPDRAELRDQFGQSLASADFDADGFDDLAVGVWFEDHCRICNEGAFHVIRGSRGGLTSVGTQFFTQDSPGVLERREPFDRFGHALAAGDFDADGFADLAVGAPRDGLGAVHAFVDHGVVNVLRGSRRGLTTTRTQLWHQDSPGIRETAHERDLFGLALGADDFDGNGADDLVVGTRYEDGRKSNTGAVNVIYGSNRGLSAAGNQLWTQDSPGIEDRAETGDLFGWTVTTGSGASGTTGEARPDYWR
jgi:disulfide bond formation protein DsbB